ncbi:RHS repeat domain-containing protein, partial [Flavobacterium sp. ZS1P70]
AGRLLSQKQKINSQLEEIIVANTYDELGQLISKGVGGNSNQARLQTVDFKYNIRGWLKNINDVNTIGTDLFAFQINYNDIADVSKKLYNGNISQTFWKTANSDSSLKNYIYTYDPLNRLTNATDNLNKFNESLAYDKNGNITNLTRLGEIVGGVPLITNPSDFGLMDNLTYTYDGGNKLQIVSDSANDTYGFKDDFIGSAADTSIDYTYDSNGNMITDTNKSIGAIAYNYLNLPTQVTIAGQKINYVYDATGSKQQKIVNGITTDYAGGFIYENGAMKFFSQPEGYVANNSGTFSYIYQYKDHLGNVRLSYGDGNNDGLVNTSEIVEENNYYPFGLKQKGYNNVTGSLGNATAQKYKYNGKELQDELGLNMYDYGARNYDPALGRWMNVDPLAEKSRRFSPYTYALNNPVFFVDPDGMKADDWIEHRTSDGKQAITYDSAITTKEQAEAKGYKGVEKVFKDATAHSADGEEFIAFAADGNYTVNNGAKTDVDDASYITKGGVHISENKGIVDALGDFGPGALQDGGDAITLAAVPVSATGIGAPLGATMATIGSGFSVTGTGLELLNDAFEGKFSFAKFVRKATIEAVSRKLGGSSAFGPTEQIVNDNIFNLGDRALDEMDK